jgi:hypothetical protein
MLRNVVGHVQAHNRILEQEKMWRVMDKLKEKDHKCKY